MFVIGQAMAKPKALLKTSLLMISAGLRPYCSCPDDGSKVSITKSPFFGM